MNTVNVINKIILLPRLVNSLNSVSMHSLLKEIGYFVLYNQISEEKIRNILAIHSECIDEWLHYSEDKRSSSGWYIIKKNKDNYVVGFLEKRGQHENTMVYIDVVDACAAFIKREIEEIRLQTEGGL